MLGELEERRGRVVIADFEAGIGSLLRLEAGQVDVAVVVAEPHPRSIEVARRLLALAESNDVPRRLLLANKVRGEEDLERLRAAFGAPLDLVVPDDPQIAAADFDARSPLDHDPDSAAVHAIRELASRLQQDSGPPL